MKKRSLRKQARELPDHPDKFDALIQARKESPHRPLTKKVLAEIWQRADPMLANSCSFQTRSRGMN